jgi:hypothetical protein
MTTNFTSRFAIAEPVLYKQAPYTVQAVTFTASEVSYTLREAPPAAADGFIGDLIVGVSSLDVYPA